jgi:hypothetical protein
MLGTTLLWSLIALLLQTLDDEEQQPVGFQAQSFGFGQF